MPDRPHPLESDLELDPAARQRREALDVGVRNRTRRGELRRAVMRRELSVVALILPGALAPEDERLLLDRALLELLGWGWKIGDRSARRLLVGAGLSTGAKLGSLSPSRRTALADVVRAGAPQACAGRERAAADRDLGRAA